MKGNKRVSAKERSGLKCKTAGRNLSGRGERKEEGKGEIRDSGMGEERTKEGKGVG